MTQTWRTLVLIYPVLDARYGSGLGQRTARRVMAREERAAIEEVVERLPAVVAEWSDGYAALDPFDIVEVRRPIKTLSSSGVGLWWPGPREVKPELESVASTGATYDSVIVLWPADPDVPQCGWGCTVGPSDKTFGAGYTAISTDHWPSLATDPDPAQGYVHEWLHQVEAVYRKLGVEEDELPSLHDASAYTSTRPDAEPPYGRSYAEYHDGADGQPGAATWAPWYRDWMTGRLRRLGEADDPSNAGADDPADDATVRLAVAGVEPGDAGAGRRIGMTPERWRLRDQA
jgi:hypothetical protein